VIILKMYDIASKMACSLAGETGLEQSKVDSVRFGLEIIVGEFIKLVVFLITAILLGVLPEAAYALAGMCLFRLLSGGQHCQDYWRCLILSLIVFIGSGMAGVFVGTYISYSTIMVSVGAGSLIIAFLVVKWAPGEVVHRKIKNEERPLFKGLSLVFLLVWALVTAVFVAPHSISAAAAGLAAMLFQSFSFTPAGYWFINRFDIELSKILGERRCFPDAEDA